MSEFPSFLHLQDFYWQELKENRNPDDNMITSIFRAVRGWVRSLHILRGIIIPFISERLANEVKNNIIYFYPQSGRVNGRCIIIKTTYDISLDFQDSLLPLGFLSRSLSSANASQKKGIIIWEIFPYPAPRLTATMKREWYRSWILWTILSTSLVTGWEQKGNNHERPFPSHSPPFLCHSGSTMGMRREGDVRGTGGSMKLIIFFCYVGSSLLLSFASYRRLIVNSREEPSVVRGRTGGGREQRDRTPTQQRNNNNKIWT